MLPEVYGNSSDAMLRRLLSRKGIVETKLERMLARVEERGSAYLPEVNAFYIREFQMMHAAEDAARFLHHACRGLPRRVNAQGTNGNGARTQNSCESATGLFYTRVVEHAVAYFGSRVLYPSRPAPEGEDSPALSRAECQKAAQSAIRGDAEKFEVIAEDWGYRLGNQIYDIYLAGKVKPSGLRRLFLAHLDETGAARKVCTAVIARVRSATRNTQSRRSNQFQVLI
jgi:hypothetical protein